MGMKSKRNSAGYIVRYMQLKLGFFDREDKNETIVHAPRSKRVGLLLAAETNSVMT